MPHDLGVLGRRQTRLAVIHPQGAQNLAAGGFDRRRPRGPQASPQSFLAARCPEGILRDIGNQHLPTEIDGRRARAIANVDLIVLQSRDQLLWQMGSDDVRELRAAIGQHAHRAHRSDADGLDEAGDGRQYLWQARVAGELREHLTLGGGDALASLALRNVRNAATHEPTAAARKPHQPDLAVNLLPERVLEEPLVYQRLAFECRQSVGTGPLCRRDAIWLARGTQLDRPYLKQLRALESEQFLSIFVDVHEASGVSVKHDYGFWSVIHQ